MPMAHDPLQALLKVRSRAVDEGRRALAEKLSVAADATKAAQSAEADIARELERASTSDGADSLVEAFAAWLPGAQQRLIQAQFRLDRQEAEVARCRADLTVCRTALEAITQLSASRRSAQEQERTRQSQKELDEYTMPSPLVPG